MDVLEEIGLEDIKTVDMEFEIHKKSPCSLKDYLKGHISPQKIDEIKKSFDIIGDVVILEITQELESEKYQIADAALKFTKEKGHLP